MVSLSNHEARTIPVPTTSWFGRLTMKWFQSQGDDEWLPILQ